MYNINMKVAIFGGTFNPPHKTHVEIANQAVRQLNLDKLLVVPCGQPTHKLCFVDKAKRMDMAKLAFAHLPVEIEPYEIDSDKPNYTLDTVKYIKSRYPSAQLFLIIGGDSLRDYDSWHCPDELAKLVTFAVAERKGVDLSNAKQHCVSQYGMNIVSIQLDATDYSSTEIRLKYQYGMDVNEVPQEVDEYIKRNGLFCEYRPMTSKLQSYLTPKRYSHTFYVTKVGLQLKSKCSEQDIFVACTLHDCAKYIGKDEYSLYNFKNDDNLPEPVVHAFLGAIVAQKDFGVSNKTILDAIKYHTTGRPDMTELDMVVYVADKIEQSRPYPTQHLVKNSLEATFLAVLIEAYEVCLKRNRATSPLTLEAIQYYEKYTNTTEDKVK